MQNNTLCAYLHTAHQFSVACNAPCSHSCVAVIFSVFSVSSRIEPELWCAEQYITVVSHLVGCSVHRYKRHGVHSPHLRQNCSCLQRLVARLWSLPSKMITSGPCADTDGLTLHGSHRLTSVRTSLALGCEPRPPYAIVLSRRDDPWNCPFATRRSASATCQLRDTVARSGGQSPGFHSQVAPRAELGSTFPGASLSTFANPRSPRRCGLSQGSATSMGPVCSLFCG